MATPSSAPSGHLLPEGEGVWHTLALRERVAEGRVRVFWGGGEPASEMKKIDANLVSVFAAT